MTALRFGEVECGCVYENGVRVQRCEEHEGNG